MSMKYKTCQIKIQNNINENMFIINTMSKWGNFITFN